MRGIAWCTVWAISGCYTLEEVGGGEDVSDRPRGGAPRDENGDGVPDDVAPDADVQSPADACTESEGDDDDAAACTECFDDGDWDCDGVANADDVDADGDAVLDQVPSAELVAAVGPIARATCEAAAACCAGGWSDAALSACALRATGVLLLEIAQEWASGFLELDPAGLDECSASVAVCAAYGVPLDGCGRYFVGKRAERQACWRDLDCAPGLYCDGESGSSYGCNDSNVEGFLCTPYPPEDYGQCRPSAGAGEECDDEDDGGPRCEPGLWCAWFTTDVCEVPPALGDPCDAYDDWTDSCSAGLTCGDSGTCEPALEVGEHCLESRRCASGRCDIAAEECEATSSSSSTADSCAIGRGFDGPTGS